MLNKTLCKKYLLICGMISCLIIGCGQAQNTIVNDNEVVVQNTNNTEVAEEIEDVVDDSIEEVDIDDVYLQYKAILVSFMETGILHFDDRDIETPEGEMNTVFKYSCFAVQDIDNDNIDELIVYYDNACMAGMIAIIYDYVDGQAKYKFSEFPNLSFYENGVIEAGWSHNQGYAGEFWPYNLYMYKTDSDEYVEVGSVDAFDKELYECNKEVLDASGISFPEEADIDGNGFVYYIYENGLEEYQKIEPVDDGVYKEWLIQYTEGSNKIVVDFYRINKETVERLGDKEYFKNLKENGSDFYVSVYY